jgi:hypothetical protein
MFLFEYGSVSSTNANAVGIFLLSSLQEYRVFGMQVSTCVEFELGSLYVNCVISLCSIGVGVFYYGTGRFRTDEAITQFSIPLS